MLLAKRRQWATPEHLPRLSGLGELALVALAQVFGAAVVVLHLGAAAHAEGQYERVQIAAVSHQLRVVGRPAHI